MGERNARGIALMFVDLAALSTRTYRRLSTAYATAPESAQDADAASSQESAAGDAR